MHRGHYQFAALALSAIVIVGFGAYTFGFTRGAESVAPIDRVTDLKNKHSNALLFSTDTAPSDLTDFAPFWRTWQVLAEVYTPVATSSAVDTNAKVIGAIQGLVDSYEDPYTVFFPPAETESFKEAIRGDFEGIGATIGLSPDGVLTVVQPLLNSPAARAGLQTADSILFIDGLSAAGLTVDEAVDSIRGPEGSEVVLTVAREDVSEPINIPIVRGVVEIPTVATAITEQVVNVVENVIDRIRGDREETETVPDSAPTETDTTDVEDTSTESQSFSVLQLASFSKTSADAFRRELTDFATSDKNNLIIDLRNNQGGFLEVAVDIASHFLEKDAVVAIERRGSQGTETYYVSEGYDTLKDKEDLRVVLLVNGNTASAAEILAGSLQEYNAALVVGEPTFGKGSVQQLIDITPEMSLKVTVARWLTPNGTSISEVGLTPDIIVEPPTDDSTPYVDYILETAIEALLTTEEQETLQDGM